MANVYPPPDSFWQPGMVVPDGNTDYYPSSRYIPKKTVATFKDQPKNSGISKATKTMAEGATSAIDTFTKGLSQGIEQLTHGVQSMQGPIEALGKLSYGLGVLAASPYMIKGKAADTKGGLKMGFGAGKQAGLEMYGINRSKPKPEPKPQAEESTPTPTPTTTKKKRKRRFGSRMGRSGHK